MKTLKPGKPYDLNERIKLFVLEIFEYIEKLPNTASARNIKGQLARSASSIGANYRASRRARSDKEYIAKLGVAEEEADESCYWLELILQANWGSSAETKLLLQEANEITAIIVTLIKKRKN
jgi:four helix bundle protein